MDQVISELCYKEKILQRNYRKMTIYHWECNGSVVECLTQDRGAPGLSLTSVTVLCP